MILTIRKMGQIKHFNILLYVLAGKTHLPIKGPCPDFPVLFVHDSPHRHRCKIVLFGKGFQIVAVVFLHDALVAVDAF